MRTTETKTVKHPGREHRTMRTIKTMAAALVLMLAFYVSLTAGTASAKTLEGTSYGDALYGTAYGGPDLAYGYGGSDLLYGGNETGRGDIGALRHRLGSGGWAEGRRRALRPERGR